MKRVITYGTFDLLHYGHINLLRRAKQYGDYLIVALSTDEFNWNEKQKKRYFSYEKRKQLLEAIRYVDLVIPEESWEQKRSDIREYHVDTFGHGGRLAGQVRLFARTCARWCTCPAPRKSPPPRSRRIWKSNRRFLKQWRRPGQAGLGVFFCFAQQGFPGVAIFPAQVQTLLQNALRGRDVCGEARSHPGHHQRLPFEIRGRTTWPCCKPWATPSTTPPTCGSPPTSPTGSASGPGGWCPTTSTSPAPPICWGTTAGPCDQVLALLRRWEICAIHCHTPVGGLVGRLAGRLSPCTAGGGVHRPRVPLLPGGAPVQPAGLLPGGVEPGPVYGHSGHHQQRGLPGRPAAAPADGAARCSSLPGVGLDRPEFSPLPPAERARLCGSGWEWRPEEFFLLSLGELNQNKNHQVVLEALSLLLKRPGLPGGHPLRHLRGGVCPPPAGGGNPRAGALPGGHPVRLPAGTSPRWWAAPTPRCFPPAGRGWAWRGWNPWPWGCR